MIDYMRDAGLYILGKGYPIIPLIAGEKRPAIEGWRTVTATPELVKNWSGGIGIRTGTVLFLDVDIPNVVSDRVRQLALRILGWAPVRIGNPPKLGLLYRTDRVYRTHLSTVFRDQDDNRCALEGLADGRQFVCAATHPVTKQPYWWVDGVGPETVGIEDLTVVTEQQLLDFFQLYEQLAQEEGWTRIGGNSATGLIGPDGVPLIAKTEPVGLVDEEVRERLLAILNDNRFDAREDWFKIGAAVHHETGGSEAGRDAFHEWSTRHPSHDEGLFRKAWDSMGSRYSDPNYRPITFRFVLEILRVQREAELRDLLALLTTRIDLAASLEELNHLSAEISRNPDIEAVQREAFANHVKEVARRLGASLSIGAIRDMMKPRYIETETPNWLKDWVFLKEVGQFYHTGSGEYLDRIPFDLTFLRHTGDIAPSRFAMQMAKIPVHSMTAYLPGEDAIYTDPTGKTFVNIYREHAPETPIEYSATDLADIEIVKNHATHLFGPNHGRDIEILHSALAYIVQTRRRINWLILIQGAEGIGKTFYAQLLKAVLGDGPHVHELTTNTLTDSSFTSWAEGHLVVYIEELMLHGKRYDVLNKMKPYIANKHVSIHGKYRKPHDTLNTTSYFAFTNFRDAIPIDSGDTRYFIMLSQWQNGEEVRQFKSANPDYYPQLWRTLERSAGALRRWLLEYELHPDFDPNNRAPLSHGRSVVISEAKPELQHEIEDLLANGNVPGVSNDFLVMHLLREALADESGIMPTPEAIRTILKRLQFTPIAGGRVKVTDTALEIRQHFYCWSKNRDTLRSTTGELRERIAGLLQSAHKSSE